MIKTPEKTSLTLRVLREGRLGRTFMDHLERIQSAIDFIEDRLREELSTETIARSAGFSTWHFQRVFNGAVGEPLMTYVRRRRLTSAMLELASSQRRILDVALDYQFESQEAFSRAFKSMWGLTPGECQKGGSRAAFPLPKPKITREYLDHLHRGARVTMKPQFVTKPEIKVVGMEAKFISILSPDKNNFTVIPALWGSYIPRSKEIGSRKGRFDVGVCMPVDEKERSHPEECLYLAGAEVDDFSRVPEGMVKRVLPAGRYAIFTHRGKLEGLEHTMSYIYGSWLPTSGETLREAPDLEIYDERFKLDSDDSEVELWIPIEGS
jgi:AraC family transcriptional regulator